VADTFSGSGQIPFEAARIGCEAYASDLNPVACMLSWGNFNIVGTDQASQDEMTAEQEQLVQEIDEEIRALKIEHDDDGNRAKVFLYCLETRCPRTGYMVPVAPSFVISRRRNVVAKLVPNHKAKRYDFDIIMGASDEDMREAALGTSRGGRLFHPLLTDELGVSIKEIRKDYKDDKGTNRNGLRLWEKSDFKPRPDDIWQERLYAIQWMDAEDIARGKAYPRTWFAAPTEKDLDRERLVEGIVEENLCAWQEGGLVPDMEIEHGNETTRLMRERGWTHWHHLYTPRSLLMGSMVTSRYKTDPRHFLNISIFANRMAKTVDWHSGEEAANHTFTNQAINTMQNYPVRGFTAAKRLLVPKYFCTGPVKGHVRNAPSNEIGEEIDIFLTDPPYADAVQYDEITEFFIAWLRRNPPAPFDEWIWDSRRSAAIKGEGQSFKAAMVETYRAMTDHMVDHGLQIIQFTHQDTKTWSDMAQIFWGAGLQVLQDWYVSTENMTELKKGGYVQGTHMIVLKKRHDGKSGYQDEIVHEIREEVERQIREMTGLNDRVDSDRGENIFNDADLQMAGYAAALRVLTAYTKIDGLDMTREALRPRRKDEKTIVDELTEFAVQTANEFLIPEGLERNLWLDLNGAERFYLKMMDIEEAGEAKLDQFQNFSKAFRVGDYDDMMASKSPNNARLKTAKQLGKTQMAEGAQFGKDSLVRLALRSVWRVDKEDEVEEILEELHDLIPNYWRQRETLMTITRYVAEKRANTMPEEAAAARILTTAIQTEHV
jgi:adenine-specific DNA methylase